VTNPIATNIVCQADKLDAAEASTYQDSDPHFSYKMFTTMLPLNNPQLVLFRDHMIDQVVIDAVTGAPRKFLIIDDPEMHVIDGHWQWQATRMRGT
jgi:hypothetical protein